MGLLKKVARVAFTVGFLGTMSVGTIPSCAGIRTHLVRVVGGHGF